MEYLAYVTVDISNPNFSQTYSKEQREINPRARQIKLGAPGRRGYEKRHGLSTLSEFQKRGLSRAAINNPVCPFGGRRLRLQVHAPVRLLEDPFRTRACISTRLHSRPADGVEETNALYLKAQEICRKYVKNHR